MSFIKKHIDEIASAITQGKVLTISDLTYLHADLMVADQELDAAANAVVRIVAAHERNAELQRQIKG